MSIQVPDCCYFQHRGATSIFFGIFVVLANRRHLCVKLILNDSGHANEDDDNDDDDDDDEDDAAAAADM